MKRLLVKTLLCFAATLLFPAISHAARPLDAIDQALLKVVSYENGQDAQPLNLVEDAVVTAHSTQEAAEALELRLIRALQAAETRTARDFLCRQLRTIGSTNSVPVLVSLLTDAESASMARYALERIGGPPVAQALRRALEVATGQQRIGIMSSLGELGYCQAALGVPKFLASSDPAVAMAAADCLAKMRNCRWAASELGKIRDRAEGDVRIHVDNALLACAENLLADGHAEEAREIYGLYQAPDQPAHLRIAALRGLSLAGGDNAAPLLLAAIRDEDPAYRANAIALVRTPGDPVLTTKLAESIPQLPFPAQALLLAALGERGDRLATPAVTASVASEDEAVRVAALTALGLIGGEDSLGALITAAATGKGLTQQAARSSLLRLPGAGIDEALVRHIPQGTAARQVETIRALAGRKAAGTERALFLAARDQNTAVREAAIAALGVLAGPASLPELINLLLEPAQRADRRAVESAAEAVLRRLPDAEAQPTPLLAVWREAPTEARPNVLRLLGISGTSDALAAVRAALGAADAALRDAAVRTLADWPSAEASPELLALARQATSPTEKALALRGYVRLAGLTPNPTDMYAQALSISRNVDERKLVLAGLGTADTFAAMDLVLPFLTQEAVQAEAALAVVQIADRARRQDSDRAKSALSSVLQAVPSGPINDRSRQIINELEQYEGYILTWEVTGPYTVNGKDARALLDLVLAPEQPDEAGIEWMSLEKGIGTWDIVLDETYGGKDDVAAYVRTGVWAPVSQPAQLELGSDDAVKAWLNGKMVHSRYAERSLSPRQDIVEVNLKEGWNQLMLKVVDRGGGWAFACRVRKHDGSAIDGLRIATTAKER